MSFPSALLLGLCAFLPPRPATFSVTIDVSGANVVLAAALADSTQAAAAADAALRNDAVRAMIIKMANFDTTVTPAAFKTAVLRLSRGGDGAPFDLARLRADPEPTRRMLARLVNDSAVIGHRLADRLQSFTPDGMNVHATLHVLVGAVHQNGWVPDSKTPDFYLDLGFHGEEVESLTNSSSHELFHVVQLMAQPGIDTLFSDRPTLAVGAREAYRSRAVLLNLVIEGMATYVGDPSLYTSTGPRITRDQHELQRQLKRAPEIFALFDTILYRTWHDPDAPLGTLLRIGFGGSWDETGYFVGYRMAKIIDRFDGRDRLRAFVAAPAQDFVMEYIRLANAHPQDPDITPLAPASIAIVEALGAADRRR